MCSVSRIWLPACASALLRVLAVVWCVAVGIHVKYMPFKVPIFSPAVRSSKGSSKKKKQHFDGDQVEVLRIANSRISKHCST